jgi:hypothetical protein
MLEIKNNVPLKELMTETDIANLDKEVNPSFYKPFNNQVNLLNSPFPEMCISKVQDGIIRSILNGN